jgi:hypothetical protein
MHRKQDDNISKIQAEVSYFDNTFMNHTKNWWPQLHPYFFKIWSFHIKSGIQRIIEIVYFVEKKISIICDIPRLKMK